MLAKVELPYGSSTPPPAISVLGRAQVRLRGVAAVPAALAGAPRRPPTARLPGPPAEHPLPRREGEAADRATLNGTLATTRWIVAILENHQQPDGSVRVPKALQSYLGGRESADAGQRMSERAGRIQTRGGGRSWSCWTSTARSYRTSRRGRCRASGYGRDREHLAAGVPVTIATGRAVWSALPTAADLGLHGIQLVCSNGAVVYDAEARDPARGDLRPGAGGPRAAGGGRAPGIRVERGLSGFPAHPGLPDRLPSKFFGTAT